MPIEIERKFLVCSDEWRSLVTRRLRLRQAYLSLEGGFSTRVRIVGDSQSTLTVKSRKAGVRRLEFEYPIPLADAELLLSLRRGAIIDKVRHIVPWRGCKWEIDVFAGDNAGLVIAEIELAHESQDFQPPPWLGAEVTGQERYYNSSLVAQPFRQWNSYSGADGSRE